MVKSIFLAFLTFCSWRIDYSHSVQNQLSNNCSGVGSTCIFMSGHEAPAAAVHQHKTEVLSDEAKKKQRISAKRAKSLVKSC